MRDATLKVLREEMAKSEAVNIQYANKLARISNYWKNSIGMNKAIVDNKVIEEKLENEAKFIQYAKRKGNGAYTSVVSDINEVVAESMRPEYLYTLTMEVISCVEFIARNLAESNRNMFIEGKPEKLISDEMNAYYNWVHNRDYNHEVDRKVAKALLPLYISLTNPEERPALINDIEKKYKGNLDKYVDYVYDNSILANQKNFDKFMKKPSLKKLENDPAMQLRKAFMDSYMAISKTTSELDNRINPLHKIYLKGLLEMSGSKPMAPDANFTMRMTYGNVKAYQPRDGVTYNHYTTLKGVMEKEDPNNSEFIVPARLKELYETKDFGEYALPNGEMPVAFLTTNDITGGNSGSGVLNSRGELIGLAFDGNWESLSGDINFDDNLQRCINVDIRYVLFIIEKFGGCNRLIEEMTIIR